MICYEKQTTSKTPVQYNLRPGGVDDWNHLRHFDNQINTGMKGICFIEPLFNKVVRLLAFKAIDTICFIRIFFTYLGTPCWYEGIDKPTTWQRLWGWRIGPVMAWRLARITV